MIWTAPSAEHAVVVLLERRAPVRRDLVKHLPLAPGSGPRHLAFHPELNVVYVLNELLSTVTCTKFSQFTLGGGEEELQ